MRRAVAGALLGAGLLALAAVAAGTAERAAAPGPAQRSSSPAPAPPPLRQAVGRVVDLAPLIDSGVSECTHLSQANETTIAALVAARGATVAVSPSLAELQTVDLLASMSERK